MHINKFSESNIVRYAEFVCWIQQTNLLKVKFIDETHFVPKSMFFKSF